MRAHNGAVYHRVFVVGVLRQRLENIIKSALDGHLRHEVLKDQGNTDVCCLVSTDDEAFTYNKRINRLAAIQEHKMILRALSLGVPATRLASALNINIRTLQQKRQLLDGICGEAAELLKDKQVALTGSKYSRR